MATLLELNRLPEPIIAPARVAVSTKFRAISDERVFQEEIEFQTKPEIALEQIRQAMEQGAPVGPGAGGCGVWEGNAVPH